jgi:hypothetical protein
MNAYDSFPVTGDEWFAARTLALYRTSLKSHFYEVLEDPSGLYSDLVE